jgi:hypothetical protein
LLTASQREGREAGERYRLRDFMAKKGPTLKHQYKKLSTEEKKGMTKDIDIIREERTKICRANPKAVQKDVNASFGAMEKEVSIRVLN